MAMEPQTCSACGKPKHKEKDLLKCGRCRQAFYHDKDCQKKHWPQHKTTCRRNVQKQQEEKQQRENLQVLETEDKGRVVVARKSFEPGDTVLLESPAVLFDTRREYTGLLEAFGKATAETQAKILDLHAPPPEQIDSPARQQRHARLEQQRRVHLSQHPNHADLLTTAVTQKLLAIIETNAHQLFNANFLDSRIGTADPQWMGLFVLGSMLEHSCNPNLTMNTTRDGKLELLAEVAIPENDRLSFSYVEGIYEKSRDQRQGLLLEEKHFHCQCGRCQAVDDCRPIPLLGEAMCESCPTTHPIVWHAMKQAYICLRTNQSLSIAQDDARIVQFQTIEEKLVQSIHTLEQQLEAGIPFETVLPKLAALMTSDDWKENIPPLHWVTVSACQFLSTTAAAMARMQNPPNASLLRLSVLALLHNIAWVEQLVSTLRQSPNDDDNTALQKLVIGDNDNDSSALQHISQTLQASLSSTNLAVPPNDLKRALQSMCANQLDACAITADALLTTFYAGQDLILAGHPDLCLRLYQRYQSWFHKLKQPNDDNRAKIDAFVASQGTTNPFTNVML